MSPPSPRHLDNDDDLSQSFPVSSPPPGSGSIEPGQSQVVFGPLQPLTHAQPPTFTTIPYADHLANMMNISSARRGDLHSYSILYQNPETQWQAMIYLQASILRMEDRLDRLADICDGLRKLVKNSEVTVTLTKPQLTVINRAAHALIMQPGRVDFDNSVLLVDIMNVLHNEHPEIIALVRECSRTGEAQLKTIVSQRLSRSKNHIRKFLRDSIYSDGMCKSLPEAIDCVQQQFVNGPLRTGQPSFELIVYVLLLRQFCRENTELLNVDDDAANDGGNSDSHLDEEYEQLAMSERPRKRKRRKKTQKKPKIPVHLIGVDFWHSFGDTLKSRYKQWGRNYREGEWPVYINQCLREEQQFDPDAQLPIDPLPLTVLSAAAGLSAISAASTSISSLQANSQCINNRPRFFRQVLVLLIKHMLCRITWPMVTIAVCFWYYSQLSPTDCDFCQH
ncbi:hypothetical protein K474DRAFT_1712568 [Panus rudis PR-1116 ss-1]|nr:hypothetical protein K474DRAFT_1712568 [Panus rudis PR-1116 ss-1]